MDKSCNSSRDSSAVSATATSSTGNNNTGGNRDHHYLRQLNKLSHKISKPTVASSSSSVSAAVNQETSHQPLPPPPQQPPINHGNLHQHQPPVYNISKSDFRDVVQKLTGSPAHERISAPPPIHHPRPQQSSRLHRIRPPPLAHVINRPPGLLNDAHRNWSGGLSRDRQRRFLLSLRFLRFTRRRNLRSPPTCGTFRTRCCLDHRR
ncbi:hypothetical protein HID58_092536 [Brassica napus]|uniref:VQ domain-containing protein n=1 Tax=Brassica napus TaxID=3708 RepID=A0ABQ7WYG8_BRANA|nr:hypothetical protein HID58_092536 [Brassica napus]